MHSLLEQRLSSDLSADGGEHLRRFVNDLISATAWACGVRSSHFILQSRGDHKDGGLDAETLSKFPGDRTGWFGLPTAWQFKSSSEIPRLLDVQHELNKPAMRDRLAKGHALRWVSRSHVAPSKVADFEALLTTVVKAINPASPPPHFLPIGRLLEWIRWLPAAKLALMEQDPGLLAFDAWTRQQEAVTQHFIMPDTWGAVATAIRDHVAVTAPVNDAVLAVVGPPGVGKTRLVHHLLVEQGFGNALAIYATDASQAIRAAQRLAASGESAILVADECDVSAQHQLGKLLAGCRSSVRVIALGNGTMRERAHVLDLRPMERRELENVLAANFPELPSEIREHVAVRAGGFVRFAADMCRSGIALNHELDFSKSKDRTADYLESRLGKDSDELAIIAALSLFPAVGITGEVADQLKMVCTLCALGDPSVILPAIRRVKDEIGFISIKGRFAHVTPELLSDAALSIAWTRWIRPDPADFLSRIPTEFQELFLARIPKTPAESRRRFADESTHFFDRLTLPAVASPAAASRLRLLVSIAPDRFLPALRRTVELATEEDWSSLTERDRVLSYAPADAILTRIAGALAYFPEYFDDAEAILFALAINQRHYLLARSGPSPWAGLFSIHLSGTSKPLIDRLRILASRFEKATPESVPLLCDAVIACLSENHSRASRPSLIAGRLPGPDWLPRTRQEAWDSQLVAARMLLTCAQRADPVGEEARRVTVDSFALLLSPHLLPAAKDALAAIPMSRIQRDLVLSHIDGVLTRLAPANDAHSSTPYKETLEATRALVAPSNLFEEVSAAIRRDSSHPTLREERDTDDVPSAYLLELAARVARCASSMPGLAELLNGRHVPASDLFCSELAAVDSSRQLLGALLQAAKESGRITGLLGYIERLMRVDAPELRTLAPQIQAIANRHQGLGMLLLQRLGDAVDGLNTALAMVDNGTAPASSLHGFRAWTGNREMTPGELDAVTSRLRLAATRGDTEAHRVLTEHVNTYVIRSRATQHAFFESAESQSAAWFLLDSQNASLGGRTDLICQLAEIMLKVDPGRLIAGSARIIVRLAISHERRLDSLLRAMMAHSATAMMDALGEVLNNSQIKYHRVRALSELFNDLPKEVVLAWLDRAGIEGALLLATQLPPPKAGSGDTVVVTPIVDALLQKFADSQELLDQYLNATIAESGFAWCGSIGDIWRKKEKVARAVLSHSNPRLREWARCYIETCRDLAKLGDQRSQEFDLPTPDI